MTISKSAKWNKSNLAHRFTVSFFSNTYSDNHMNILNRDSASNKELLYFNQAIESNSVNAQICAGLLISYMENQGIPYHKIEVSSRDGCYKALLDHLLKGDGTVLYTADIIDHYFKFLGE